MDRFAAVADAVAQVADPQTKVRLVAEYLRGLNDADLVRAIRFFTKTTRSITNARIREALQSLLPWDAETVKQCFTEVADAGETTALLLHGIALQPQPLTLEQAERYYDQLENTPRKAGLLRHIFTAHNSCTIAYFIKATYGNLRIGLDRKLVEQAIAVATGAHHDHVRDAANRNGDLTQVALAARRGELHTVAANLFHPMDFMLATPAADVPVIEDASEWLVEDKYDGVRAQIHNSHNRVCIFSRKLKDITSAYPDIVNAIRFLPQTFIADGLLLNNTFVAFDLLYLNGELLLDSPIQRRRAALEQVFNNRPSPLCLSGQQPLEAVERLQFLLAQAIDRGNQGLVLKRCGSAYESGRRSASWLKVKPPFATLDVVITAAEQGTGRHATTFTGYTLAVRDEDRFLNIGKVNSGLSDNEMRELTRLLRSVTTERFGKVILVEPRFVLEIACDGVQKSRHKSGYALRLPRIVRWRRDKTAAQVDDMSRVIELYEQSLV